MVQLNQAGCEVRWFHAFLKLVSLSVNVIAQLEFELAYYDVIIQLVSLYAMRTPLQKVKIFLHFL